VNVDVEIAAANHAIDQVMDALWIAGILERRWFSGTAAAALRHRANPPPARPLQLRAATHMRRRMIVPLDPTEQSVVVKLRAPAPNSWDRSPDAAVFRYARIGQPIADAQFSEQDFRPARIAFDLLTQLAHEDPQILRAVIWACPPTDLRRLWRAMNLPGCHALADQSPRHRVAVRVDLDGTIVADDAGQFAQRSERRPPAERLQPVHRQNRYCLVAEIATRTIAFSALTKSRRELIAQASSNRTAS
jgi:hypothetical protein